MMEDIPLYLLPSTLAVCRLPADSAFPEWARPGDLLAFLQTRQELSVICEERYVPPEIKAERGWRALEVQGPLDFTMVGVLASILDPLREAGVSILALSTFDTDYVLVKDSSLDPALLALQAAGFTIITPQK